jgi:ferredoxin
MRRIRVDRVVCFTAGSCVEIAPEVFQIDEARKAYVVDPNGADEDTIFEAAESCPTAAIILEDADGKQLYP